MTYDSFYKKSFGERQKERGGEVKTELENERGRTTYDTCK